MAREVQVLRWCDAAEDADNAEPATVELVVELVVDGQPVAGGRRLVDLCEQHAKAVVDPLGALLTSHSSPVEAQDQPRPTAPQRKQQRTYSGHYPCLACTAVWSGDSSLREHLATEHGWRAGVAAAHGKRCPVCGVEDHRRGWLKKHAASDHSLPTTAMLFARARRDGDPHGVVAERAAAVAGRRRTTRTTRKRSPR